jgi:hypothetical protein
VRNVVVGKVRSCRVLPCDGGQGELEQVASHYSHRQAKELVAMHYGLRISDFSGAGNGEAHRRIAVATCECSRAQFLRLLTDGYCASLRVAVNGQKTWRRGRGSGHLLRHRKRTRSRIAPRAGDGAGPWFLSCFRDVGRCRYFTRILAHSTLWSGSNSWPASTTSSTMSVTVPLGTSKTSKNA